MTKVGDKLYWQKNWHTESWISAKITGETTKSWLAGHSKINKKTMLEGQGAYSPTRWYTKKGMEDFIWISNNAQRIGSAVSGSRDVELLKTIAQMIGCTVLS